MAYAVKYRLTFEDNNLLEWICNIYQEDYVGAVTDIKGTGTPLDIRHNGKDLFDPVRPSSATLNIISETDAQYSEFYVIEETEYYLEVMRDGTAFWYGVLMQEQFEEAYTDPPYTVRLQFADLGVLKFKKYINGANFFEGFEEIITILKDCLDKLPYQLPLTEIVNSLEDDTMDALTRSFINSIYLDRRVFVDYNKKEDDFDPWYCYKVIEEIMKSRGLNFFQHEARWYITKVKQLEIGTAQGINYTSALGTTIDSTPTIDVSDSVTEDFDTGITYLDQSVNMKISEIFDELLYVYSWKNPDASVGELVSDWEMEKSSGQGSAVLRMQWWALNNVTAGTDVDKVNPEYAPLIHGYTPDFDVNHYVLEFKKAFLQANRWVNTSLYISPIEGISNPWTFNNLYWTANDKALLSFKMRVITKDDSSGGAIGIQPYIVTWRMILKIIGTSNTYYLKYTQSGGGAYTWETTSEAFTFVMSRTVDEADLWYLPLGSTDQQVEWWYDMQAKIPPPPVEDEYDVQLRCRIPTTGAFTSGGATWDVEKIELWNLSIVFMPSAKLYSEEVREIINIGGERERIKKIEVKLGDGPHVALRTSFKVINGSSNYEATDEWFTRGSGITEKGAVHFLLNPYGTYLGQARQLLSGSFTTQQSDGLPFYRSLVFNDGKAYVQVACGYNVKAAVWNLELEEVLTRSWTPSEIVLDSGIINGLLGVGGGTIDNIGHINHVTGLSNIGTISSGTNHGNLFGLSPEGGTIELIDDEYFHNENHTNFPGGG